MKSESGSVSKFKIGSHNAQVKEEDTPQKKSRIDPRMDYFEDYGENTPKIGTSKNIRNMYGSM